MEACFSGAGPESWGAGVGYEPFALEGEILVLSSLPSVGWHAWGGVYGEIVSQPLLPA